jgi:hypothetical protein
MARRGNALYLRGKAWYLDCCLNGTRYQRRLGWHDSMHIAVT